MKGLGVLPGVAAALLILALALDIFWYMPQNKTVDRLLARRARVQEQIQEADKTSRENTEVLNYFREREEPDADWHERYASQEALDVLERVRAMSGVRRGALSLDNKETGGGFVRSTYYMSVRGRYSQQVKFVRALEEALPLVSIQSFIMENPPGGGSQVSLSLNAQVTTLGGS